MSIKGPLPILVTLVIGIFLGWLVRGTSLTGDHALSVEKLRRSRQGAKQPDVRQLHSGRTRPADLDIESAENSDPIESLPVSPDNLTRLIGIKVKELELRTQLVDPGDPLEQVIGVTDHEAGQLNELWNRLKPALDSIRSDHVIHQDLDNGGIWFGVEPFPENGESLRHDFLLTTIKTLGETRARVFLNAIKAHEAFGRWGRSIGSGFAVHTFVQDDNSLIYEIFEDSSTTGKRGRKWNSSTIPPHLKELVQSSHAELPGIISDQ